MRHLVTGQGRRTVQVDADRPRALAGQGATAVKDASASTLRPGLGLLTINALTAADKVMVPVQSNIADAGGPSRAYGRLSSPMIGVWRHRRSTDMASALSVAGVESAASGGMVYRIRYALASKETERKPASDWATQ